MIDTGIPGLFREIGLDAGYGILHFQNSLARILAVSELHSHRGDLIPTAAADILQTADCTDLFFQDLGDFVLHIPGACTWLLCNDQHLRG